MTTTFPTRIIDITHHRDLILAVDAEVSDWLRANGVRLAIPPIGRHVAVRDGSGVYVLPEGAPVRPHRVGADWTLWPVMMPMPDTLAERAEVFWFASTDIDGAHYGASMRVPEDDMDESTTSRRLTSHVAKGVINTLAPECSCGAKATHVLLDNSVNVCTQCLAVAVVGAKGLGRMPLFAFTNDGGAR